MKRGIFYFLIMLFTVKSQSQILEYYKSIENKQDTLLDLRYFKTIEVNVAQKIDSFFLLKKRGEKSVVRDTSYIEVNFYRKPKNGNSINASIYENKNYCDYTIHFPIRYSKDNIIAFTFYKSKLIVFSVPYNIGKVKKEYASLLKDLIYNEMRQDVKNDIDANTDEVEVIISIGKSYIVEKNP